VISTVPPAMNGGAPPSTPKLSVPGGYSTVNESEAFWPVMLCEVGVRVKVPAVKTSKLRLILALSRER